MWQLTKYMNSDTARSLVFTLIKTHTTHQNMQKWLHIDPQTPTTLVMKKLLNIVIRIKNTCIKHENITECSICTKYMYNTSMEWLFVMEWSSEPTAYGLIAAELISMESSARTAWNGDLWVIAAGKGKEKPVIRWRGELLNSPWGLNSPECKETVWV